MSWDVLAAVGVVVAVALAIVLGMRRRQRRRQIAGDVFERLRAEPGARRSDRGEDSVIFEDGLELWHDLEMSASGETLRGELTCDKPPPFFYVGTHPRSLPYRKDLIHPLSQKPKLPAHILTSEADGRTFYVFADVRHGIPTRFSPLARKRLSQIGGSFDLWVDGRDLVLVATPFGLEGDLHRARAILDVLRELHEAFAPPPPPEELDEDAEPLD